MKICNLKAAILKKIVVAGGMALCMTGSASALPVFVGDQGFEDHVIDEGPGYAYGAAGQTGDPDGWNNASSASGLSSPWQSENENGNGIGGGGTDSSYMYITGYAPGGLAAPIGGQALELQNALTQTLAATYQQGFYTLTVAAGSSVAGNFDMVFYDGAAAAPTNSAGANPLVANALNAGTNQVYAAVALPATFTTDYSVVFEVVAASPLIGNQIGIGFDSSTTQLDNVRLELVASGELPPRLIVDTTLGTVIMAGGTHSSIDIDFYEITSAGNSLDSSGDGWNSFSDQGLDAIDGPDVGDTVGDGVGETWDEAGGSGTGLLREQFLLGSSVFDVNETQTLGAAYDELVNARDLAFSYGEVNAASLIAGGVIYVDSLLGDMNGDGNVTELDAPLFVVALVNRQSYDALGHDFAPGYLVNADLTGDINGDGTFDLGDLAAFSGLLGGPASASAVPEPSAWFLALLALAGVAGRRRAAGQLAGPCSPRITTN